MTTTPEHACDSGCKAHGVKCGDYCETCRITRQCVYRANYDTPEPQETGQAWRDISTAPKDGTWMLGWNSDCGCFVWRDGPGLITGEDPEPTHWMPLPALPREQETP